MNNSHWFRNLKSSIAFTNSMYLGIDFWLVSHKPKIRLLGELGPWLDIRWKKSLQHYSFLLDLFHSDVNFQFISIANWKPEVVLTFEDCCWKNIPEIKWLWYFDRLKIFLILPSIVSLNEGLCTLKDICEDLDNSGKYLSKAGTLFVYEKIFFNGFIHIKNFQQLSHFYWGRHYASFITTVKIF